MTSYRWIRVSTRTGLPISPTVSYPSKALCQAYCKPGEVPALARIIGRPGPFQDHLEVVTPVQLRNDKAVDQTR